MTMPVESIQITIIYKGMEILNLLISMTIKL